MQQFLTALMAMLLGAHSVLGCCVHHAHSCSAVEAPASSPCLAAEQPSPCALLTCEDRNAEFRSPWIPCQSLAPHRHGNEHCQATVCVFTPRVENPFVNWLDAADGGARLYPAAVLNSGGICGLLAPERFFVPRVRAHLLYRVLLI